MMTNLCESNTQDSLFDSLLCLTNFFNRYYNGNQKFPDNELVKVRCQNILGNQC